MDEEIIPFIAIFLIILAWVFYNNLSGKRQKFYKKGEKFEDDFGEYFEEDIKKLIKYVEDLPKVNQINIYENVLREIGRHTKEQNKGKHSVVYKKNVLAAGKLRRKNADIALGYKNPKWLAPTIFESYLRSESEKMSFNKGAKIREYLFLKMKELIPNNHNLKILLRINNIK
jgi:hypothetical protein